ncbi:DUF2291 family protein [Emticicia sp. CRIBPO]|uniref:DUF2291 domain-containing protein n=1 Tax=Emticicia sp. CRIBPO TaxID=2683258 RepID=UPI001413255A|nr:DUF2291 domain-containing protein [Emticicia sp. CRIBPO]NBA85215.1 DUF2291 family protein [Emticicia sp. CRIBPO]
MNKIYRYIIAAVLVLFLGYKSIYFKKLSEVKQLDKSGFDYDAYADTLYNKGILSEDMGVGLDELMFMIQTKPDSAFSIYGNRLGIGNSAYFMVKGNGRISAVQDGSLKILTEKGESVTLDSKYIFGNDLRDASRLVKLTDFKTNAEFNKVSEALNTLVREKVIAPTVQRLREGDKISFMGALKLNRKHLSDIEFMIIPAQITLQ